MTYPETPGYAAGSATSRAAAEALTSGSRNAQAILAWLKDMGRRGGTCFEAVQMLRENFGGDIQMNAVSPRLTELQEAGRISATPDRRKNPGTTRSGTVYVYGKWADHIVPGIVHRAPGLRGDIASAQSRVDIETERLMTSGHGHAATRRDGFKCRHPLFCRQCRQEKEYLAMLARRVEDLKRLEGL